MSRLLKAFGRRSSSCAPSRGRPDRLVGPPAGTWQRLAGRCGLGWDPVIVTAGDPVTVTSSHHHIRYHGHSDQQRITEGYAASLPPSSWPRAHDVEHVQEEHRHNEHGHGWGLHPHCYVSSDDKRCLVAREALEPATLLPSLRPKTSPSLANAKPKASKSSLKNAAAAKLLGGGLAWQGERPRGYLQGAAWHGQAAGAGLLPFGARGVSTERGVGDVTGITGGHGGAIYWQNDAQQSPPQPTAGSPTDFPMLPSGALWAVAAAAPEDATLVSAWEWFRPVDAWVQAILQVHTTTGLPWWAVIAGTAATVRLSLLPVTLRGLRANAGLWRAVAAESARAKSLAGAHDAGSAADAAAAAGVGATVATDNADATVAASAGGSLAGDKGAPVDKGSSSDSSPTAPASLQQHRPGFARGVLQRASEMGAPHPAWILGSPAIQIPFLLVATMSMRQLAFQDGVVGLDTEGALWFQDLSTVGQGLLGYALPGLLGVAFLANINFMFERVSLRRPAGAKETSTDLLMSLYKGFLHLAGFLVFLAAAHMPQAVQLYWLSNNSISLAQTLALRHPTVKAWVGMGPPGLAQPSPFRQAAGTNPSSAHVKEPSNKREAAAASSTGQVMEAILEMNAILKKESAEAAQLLQDAALLKAQGNNEGALTKLRQLVDLHNNNTNASAGSEVSLSTGRAMALYAMGDIYSACDRWQDAAESFLSAARDPAVPTSERADYLFRAAVAMAKQGGKVDAAEQVLREVTAMRPDMLEAHVSLASVLVRANHKHEALDALRAAAMIDSSVEERFLRPLEKELKEK